MGYYPQYANYLGFILPEDEQEKAYDLLDIKTNDTSNPIAVIEVGEFNGADSRIDALPLAVVFRAYTKTTNDDIDGDIRGVATQADLQEMQAFCQKHGLTFSTPERQEVNFTV